MSFTNAELKSRGKAAFKANFWPCVVVALVMSAFQALGTVSGGKFEYVQGQLVQTPPSSLENGIHFLLGILLTSVISVGACRFFLNNREHRAVFSDILCGFKENYTNIVFVRLITGIKVILWTLLLIIPGIVKSYSWCLVPYLLSDDPSMDYKTAQRTSAELMQGRKMQRFMLDLSFLGWIILGVLTLGIGMMLWTVPYMEATSAEWYAALTGKDQKTGYGDTYQDPYGQDVYGQDTYSGTGSYGQDEGRY